MKPYVYKRADDLGIPVAEAKRRLLVTVTDEDVVKAKKADSKHCALARAALRLPNVNAAYFFRSTAFLEYEDKMVRFNLPESVRREIVSFDRAQIMAAGVYQLSPMPASLTRRAQRSYDKVKRKPRRIAEGRKVSAEALARIVAGEPKNDTREQRELDNRIATAENLNAGRRTVSGAKGRRAPEPLGNGSPTKRYVHRTQYVRDLKEPAA